MDVTRVSVDVPTRAPTGQTNAYVLGQDPAVLVDPAARTDALDAAIADRNVAHVAVTHTHPDHVAGVAAYADALDATVWARPGRTDTFEVATGVTPDATFRDGDAIADVQVLDTPGHAPDHVAFAVETNGEFRPTDAGATDLAIVCGDLAVASGSVVVGHPEGDVRAYLTSLRRVRARNPAVLHPGHGPRIDDPQEVCERLIRHRLDREARVRDAIHDGARTLDAVVDAAYDKDLTGVRDLAKATVRAHIEKLVVEGEIDWDDTLPSAALPSNAEPRDRPE
jgi:ribonuclease/clavin/mitogillin